ncbi:hypothetical protein EUTSA_v10023055mg [Eutrema salsugineum]|uniref:DUF4283 domain-containing protein n=1 Tax=Eutrema salsugineum TaxID=72664 RepID=V4MDT0_EUTSA|nr:hypothetical protein EUTSA_v10023055mg [Eutrema salsugineum]
MAALEPPVPVDIPPDLVRPSFSDDLLAVMPRGSPLVSLSMAPSADPLLHDTVQDSTSSQKPALIVPVLGTSAGPSVSVPEDPVVKDAILSSPVLEEGSPVEATASSSGCSPVSLWANRFGSSLRNLKKMALPTSFMEDGTPTVLAPDSVSLKAADLWKDHVVAYFHGSPPSAARIFADLNPIWGTHGRISVKVYSPCVCLIFIPSEDTRKWVLNVGFWQAGNCAFSVVEWSPTVSLVPKKLLSAPVWIVLRNVSPALYTLEGLSVIGSAIGDPLYTERSRLVPNNLGIAIIKMEIVLGRKLLSAVRVTDKEGDTIFPRKSHS